MRNRLRSTEIHDLLPKLLGSAATLRSVSGRGAAELEQIRKLRRCARAVARQPFNRNRSFVVEMLASFDRRQSGYRIYVTNDNVVSAFEHRAQSALCSVVGVLVTELMSGESQLRQYNQENQQTRTCQPCSLFRSPSLAHLLSSQRHQIDIGYNMVLQRQKKALIRYS